MGKTAFGSISGVPWSTEAWAAYTVIMENVEIDNQSDPKTLEDEVGAIVLHVQDGEKTEVSFDATIKGTTHFGVDSLRGSIIATCTDSDVPVPLFVTSNGISKTKREWAKCKMTAVYYGASFTTGTLITETGGFTTTTSGA